MPVFIKTNFFDKLLERFPKLANFNLSTNLVRNQHKLIQFYEACEEAGQKHNRRIHIDVQLSVDGDEEITDKNRGRGVTQEVIKTLAKLGEYYRQTRFQHIRISHHFKPTIQQDEFRIFTNGGIERVIAWFKFYDELLELLHNENPNIRISTALGPTLQLPGYYTKEDGLLFAEVTKLFIEAEKCKFKHVIPLWQYTQRFRDALLRWNELYNYDHNRWISCSAGRSQLGLSPTGTISMCHDGYFYDVPEFSKSVVKGEVSVESRFGYKTAVQLANRLKAQNEMEVLKLLYNTSIYNDFMCQRIYPVVALQLNLKKYGFITDPHIGEDETYTQLFQLYVISAFQCPAQNIMTTGSIFIPSQSILLILGNGQFEQIVKQVAQRWR